MPKTDSLGKPFAILCLLTLAFRGEMAMAAGDADPAAESGVRSANEIQVASGRGAARPPTGGESAPPRVVGTAIGGTGKTADVGIGGTGIVGVVTGFGSIFVNGLEIDYDASTPVYINGVPASAIQLRVGQVVEVFTKGTGERLTAEQIIVRYLLWGPLTSTNAPTRELRIAGQPVRFDEHTVIEGASGDREEWMAELPEEQPLRVSGFRRHDGVIVATRIDVGAAGAAGILGTAERTAQGAMSVAGVAVEIPESLASDAPAPGRKALIAGRWNGTAIEAGRIELLPEQPFAVGVRDVVIQGIIHERLSAQQVRIGSVAIEVASDAAISGGDAASIAQDQLVIVHARRADSGVLSAEKILFGDAIPRPKHEAPAAP